MRATISSRRPRRPAGPVLVATGTMVVLAGCGSAVAGGSARPAANTGGTPPRRPGVALCASAGRLDQVTLRLPGSPAREILPRGDDHGRAPGPGPGRRAAPGAAARGLRHCPAALPGVLVLEFRPGSRVHPGPHP